MAQNFRGTVLRSDELEILFVFKESRQIENDGRYDSDQKQVWQVCLV